MHYFVHFSVDIFVHSYCHISVDYFVHFSVDISHCYYCKAPRVCHSMARSVLSAHMTAIASAIVSANVAVTVIDISTVIGSANTPLVSVMLLAVVWEPIQAWVRTLPWGGTSPSHYSTRPRRCSYISAQGQSNHWRRTAAGVSHSLINSFDGHVSCLTGL